MLCALGAGMANIAVALAVKGAERRGCRPSTFGAFAMTTAAAISLAAASCQSGTWLDWRLWALGVTLGALFYAAIVSMVTANRFGPPSLPWTMANLALLAPILLAALFLGETLRPMDGLMLLAFGGMLAAFTRGTLKARDVAAAHPAALLLWLTLVFAFNGLLMFGFKLNASLPPDVNPALRARKISPAETASTVAPSRFISARMARLEQAFCA